MASAISGNRQNVDTPAKRGVTRASGGLVRATGRMVEKKRDRVSFSRTGKNRAGLFFAAKNRPDLFFRHARHRVRARVHGEGGHRTVVAAAADAPEGEL